MRARILTSILLASASTACLVEAPGSQVPGAGDPAVSAAALVANAAPVRLPNGAILEDKLEIVDVVMEPGRAFPGEVVRVTAKYRVLEKIPQDYLVFVHVEDVDGRLERMNVDHAPVSGTRPTSSWEKGEVVEDTFAVNVPATAASELRGLNVWAGFWHAQSDTRLTLKNPDKVRNDGRNRVLLGTLKVGQ
ncbi:MAG: hypothetical protein WBV82_20165 [Myxococcaceae bacterium]